MKTLRMLAALAVVLITTVAWAYDPPAVGPAVEDEAPQNQNPKEKVLQANGQEGRGDGFQFLLTWNEGNKDIVIPTLDAAMIAKIHKEIETLKPDLNLTYSGLFEPGDQQAFNETQVLLYVLYDKLSEHVTNIKKIFARSYVAIHRFQVLQSGSGSQLPKNMTAATVYQGYQTAMRDNYRTILGYLSSRVILNMDEGKSYAYGLDSSGKNVVWVAEVADTPTLSVTHPIYGTVPDLSPCVDKKSSKTDVSICGASLLKKRTKGRYESLEGHDFDLIDVARQACVSEACVAEISKISYELLDLAKELDTKVKFKEVNNEFHLFYSPKNSTLRTLMARFLSDKLNYRANQDISLFARGLFGLTNLTYMAITTPIDLVANLRSVNLSLDFDPEYFGGGGYAGKFNRDFLRPRETSFKDLILQKINAVVANQK